jgi:hypothetical protein
VTDLTDPIQIKARLIDDPIQGSPKGTDPEH